MYKCLWIREPYQQLERLSFLVHIHITEGSLVWYKCLKFHAPTENKIDNVKDSLYEELKHVFDKFTNYRMKMLLGDFSVKEGKEDILKPIIMNENLHKINNEISRHCFIQKCHC
jgi:hypothetical protein